MRKESPAILRRKPDTTHSVLPRMEVTSRDRPAFSEAADIQRQWPLEQTGFPNRPDGSMPADFDFDSPLESGPVFILKLLQTLQWFAGDSLGVQQRRGGIAGCFV